jgi:hypothetical protein
MNRLADLISLPRGMKNMHSAIPEPVRPIAPEAQFRQNIGRCGREGYNATKPNETIYISFRLRYRSVNNTQLTEPSTTRRCSSHSIMIQHSIAQAPPIHHPANTSLGQ